MTSFFIKSIEQQYEDLNVELQIIKDFEKEYGNKTLSEIRNQLLQKIHKLIKENPELEQEEIKINPY